MSKEFIIGLRDKVLNGQDVSVDEAIKVMGLPEDEAIIGELMDAANKIREKFCGEDFDTCSIMNVKSGHCSEDCTYCSQSTHYTTNAPIYDLLSKDEILERAKEMEAEGVRRFSLVSSGKSITDDDFEKVIDIYKEIKEKTGLKICASHGIISDEQAKKLKEVGIDRYHHNIETSPEYYKEICTTHTFADRVQTIKHVVDSELEICSGGIIGLGEKVQDRVEMAFELKRLNVKSIPINILMPIDGTPLGSNEIVGEAEAYKTIAMFRLVNPDSTIRYGGGRKALGNDGKAGLLGGVNGALVGNYLTTVGNKVADDLKMIKEAGFKVFKMDDK